MAMEWTQRQRQVIEARGRNLLVSASAGSGKTAVLVERILRMITDREHPVDIDRLLVMTFTNAAAAEMRERIGQAIQARLQEDPDWVHLQRQVTMVHHAPITTIDSYCLSLLRDYYNHLGIDPSFRVAEEGELRLLQAEVMDGLLEDYYQEARPEFLEFVDAYGTGKTDARIEEYIRQVCRFALSSPWPEEWLEGCGGEADIRDPGELAATPWMRFIMRDVGLQAVEMAEGLRAAMTLCGEPGGPEAYLPALEAEQSQLEGLSGAEDFFAWRRRLAAVTFSRLAPIRKGADVDPDKKAAVAAIRDRVKKAVAKWKEEFLGQSEEEMLLALSRSQEPLGMLLELAREYLRRYGAQKRERNLVDFNDLEHMALRLLIERRDGQSFPTAVADELSGRYVEIMVDEYQDSNLVQETLTWSLSGERFGRPNVFMVGDVKQSIYKFRQARPELFMTKYDTYTREDGPRQLIELDQNFRSRGLVLDSINHIFFRIMTRALGNIEYTEEASLHTGMRYPETDGNAGTPTELLLVDAAPAHLEGLDEDQADYTVKDLEARLLVQTIRSLTDEGTGLRVWDKEQGAYRTARYRDIVILLRSVSQWAEVFLEVLSGQGIPAYAESRTGYFDAVEVEAILSLLSVIDNPMQDIPLAAVFKSPFVGLDDGEMARLMAGYKQGPKKKDFRGLYGAWKMLEERAAAEERAVAKERAAAEERAIAKEQAAAEERAVAEKREAAETGAMAEEEEGPSRAPLDEEERGIYGKLAAFWELLGRLRFQSTYLQVHELLYVIFEETGYYEYVSALPGGEARKGNLEMLVDKAVDFGKTRYQGLFHFVRYIEKLKKSDADFGEAALVGGQEDTVRIMSIHKSKGLEFPIVLLAGLSKRFNRQDAYQRLLMDEDMGLAADYVDIGARLRVPTIKKQVLKRKLELDSMGEELRVLYVAMTRAKEKLIMTAVDPQLEKRLERWRQESGRTGPVPYRILSMAGCYLDWVLMGLAEETDLVQVSQVEAGELAAREVDAQLGKWESKERWLEFDVTASYSEPAARRLEERFGYRYPFERDVLLPAKLSVSELKRRGQELDREGSAPLGDLSLGREREADRGQGAYVGTAYHQVLERLPFGQIRDLDGLGLWLGRMVEGGRLPGDYPGLLDLRSILAFLRSGLGRRMAGAEADGRLRREQQFVFGIPAKEFEADASAELVLVQGVIDAWVEEPDGLVIVDYKTDKVRSPDILRKRYEKQLYYYQMALEQITGRPVKERLIYSLSLQKEIAL